jgi:hypothetical protein
MLTGRYNMRILQDSKANWALQIAFNRCQKTLEKFIFVACPFNQTIMRAHAIHTFNFCSYLYFTDVWVVGDNPWVSQFGESV